MTKPYHFIDRKAFERLLSEMPRADGGNYEDISTIYGDLSRLVVGWLAQADAKELRDLYNEVGWGGSANIRALQEAAREWLRRHRPVNR